MHYTKWSSIDVSCWQEWPHFTLHADQNDRKICLKKNATLVKNEGVLYSLKQKISNRSDQDMGNANYILQVN